MRWRRLFSLEVWAPTIFVLMLVFFGQLLFAVGAAGLEHNRPGSFEARFRKHAKRPDYVERLDPTSAAAMHVAQCAFGLLLIFGGVSLAASALRGPKPAQPAHAAPWTGNIGGMLALAMIVVAGWGFYPPWLLNLRVISFHLVQFLTIGLLLARARGWRPRVEPAAVAISIAILLHSVSRELAAGALPGLFSGIVLAVCLLLVLQPQPDRA